MEFKQIEAFVNVVKHKSFSKAADASFLTQPTISAHVSALERELGVPLLERLGKESRPTKEGRAFYKYALDMINTREKALLSIKQNGQELEGVLEIQASSIPGQYMVPELISVFSERYPKVRFYVEQSDSAAVLENLCEQKTEIGFAGCFKDNGLLYERINSMQSVLITPKTEEYKKLWEKRHVVDIAQMEGKAFIWREEGSATREAFEQLYAERIGERPSVIATMNSIEAIKRAVSWNLGVAILPEISVDRAEDEGIFSFELRDEAFDREFYLISKRNAVLSPVASAFRKFVLNYYR